MLIQPNPKNRYVNVFEVLKALKKIHVYKQPEVNLNIYYNFL